jgi:rare lipoprotein A
MRSFVERTGIIALPLTLAAALSACGGGDQFGQYDVEGLEPAPDRPVVAAAGAGPAADYPIVIGDPYVVAGTVYEPQDVLNYDEVGYISIDSKGGNTVSAEHHTLPLPSYVEVTALDSGRTILVRVERRGPMTGNFLVGLSRAAASQLGVMAGAPVRVRRVNPPEQERAMLRAGQQAPARMDTPKSLVDVLRRKLPNGEGPVSDEYELASAPLRPEPAADDSLALPPLDGPSYSAPAAVRTSSRAPVVYPAARQPVVYPAASDEEYEEVYEDGFVVQAGAYSSWENANRVARVIGGEVSKAGSLYRVRTGPFSSRREAEASLAKVRAAGYSDARIFDEG